MLWKLRMGTNRTVQLTLATLLFAACGVTGEIGTPTAGFPISNSSCPGLYECQGGGGSCATLCDGRVECPQRDDEENSLCDGCPSGQVRCNSKNSCVAVSDECSCDEYKALPTCQMSNAPADECRGIPATGICSTVTSFAKCIEGQAKTIECPAGRTCTDAPGGPQCKTTPAGSDRPPSSGSGSGAGRGECAGKFTGGTCKGNKQVFCINEMPYEFGCASGQTCSVVGIFPVCWGGGSKPPSGGKPPTGSGKPPGSGADCEADSTDPACVAEEEEEEDDCQDDYCACYPEDTETCATPPEDVTPPPEDVTPPPEDVTPPPDDNPGECVDPCECYGDCGYDGGGEDDGGGWGDW